jgi:D-glycero-D-manno-heptose 1,7-bisphosphate phosphatase
MVEKKGGAGVTLFLDRDGTLIRDHGRKHLGDTSKVELLPGVVEGLALLAKAGARFVLVTNQGFVNLGLIRLDQMHEMNGAVMRLLSARGVTFSLVLYCPHAPKENCGCRKPRDGMGVQARLRENLRGPFFMVGDKGVDVGFGRGLGARTILLPRGDGGSLLEGWDMKPDYRAPDFLSASRWILKHAGCRQQAAGN